MAHILIVEDEEAISDLILMNLTMVGHTGIPCYDGNSALELMKKEAFDLCLLDVMLPGQDGFSLLAHFKQAAIPVIFLTAKGSLTDRVRGLTEGAEDYIVKPFETMELLARIDVVLRRRGHLQDSFRLGEIEVILKERIVRKFDAVIELTSQEYSLLEALIKNRNLALTREQLLNAAWGYDYMGETRTVDMHIQRLRKKLNWENYIKTVYKFGYRLEVPKE